MFIANKVPAALEINDDELKSNPALLKKVLSDSHQVQDPQQCFPKSGLLTIFGSQGFLFWSARKKPSHLYRKWNNTQSGQ
jgi:hypothetical protein